MKPFASILWLKRFLVFYLLLASTSTARADVELDLSKAVVVSPPNLSKQQAKAVTLLVEEVQKRSWQRWDIVPAWPAEKVPVIAVGPISSLKAFAGPYTSEFVGKPEKRQAEGYTISVQKVGREVPSVLIVGSDARGVLFGVGRLLRELGMARGRVTLADGFHAESAPKYPLRGHQLGYRPKTNSYDGWDLALWEQYIRDLAVFGTNAVELIPPRSDDDADSPHFPLPPMEMMVGMSRLLADYGLDVWIWYPAMDRDYSDPKTVASALIEWGEVFRRLPRIDAIFVPGGDPGHTPPRVLLAFLEKQKANLHRYHANAQMWVSPQGFSQAWLDEFCTLLRKEEPAWLNGVVYGPQVRISLPRLRQAIPKRYPLRRYPDITHSRTCQYPVPDWDLAYALTEAREVINPRPLDQAHLFRSLQAHAIGFISYSEGCNDDVNKFVWSGLGWDPETPVIDILRQYSRYFIGERYRDSFAQGLLALERNWQSPLLTNDAVYTTLEQFRALERAARPQDLLNWRFQQALYRAYYDAYLRSRLIYETGLEERAQEKLRSAAKVGSLLAMRQAETILDQALTNKVALDWRARVHELAEALFQSIRMQLSVQRYQAINIGRGANLDTIDLPLNNRNWLKQQFAALRGLPSESARLVGIEAILNWTNPGPGGFYDNLGNPAQRPHLVPGPGFLRDPGFFESPRTGFGYAPGWRLSWCRHAEVLFDAPIQMRYTGLDPAVQYKVRIVYAGDNFRSQVELKANETVVIHPFLRKEVPVRPVEYDIPKATTKQGHLTLTWRQEPGRGGSGRGVAVHSLKVA